MSAVCGSELITDGTELLNPFLGDSKKEMRVSYFYFSWWLGLVLELCGPRLHATCTTDNAQRHRKKPKDGMVVALASFRKTEKQLYQILPVLAVCHGVRCSLCYKLPGLRPSHSIDDDSSLLTETRHPSSGLVY